MGHSLNRAGLLLISLGLAQVVPGAAQTAPAKWLSYDAASKTVTFALEAGAPGTSGPFNFNGFTNGAATLVVPPGSNVVLNFVNLDGTPHSAEIIDNAETMPNIGGDPAIPAAYTRGLTEGLAQGAKDIIRFVAPPTGDFRIFCGVPGHGLSGMWIRFRVDPAAKVPSWMTK